MECSTRGYADCTYIPPLLFCIPHTVNQQLPAIHLCVIPKKPLHGIVWADTHSSTYVV